MRVRVRVRMRVRVRVRVRDPEVEHPAHTTDQEGVRRQDHRATWGRVVSRNRSRVRIRGRGRVRARVPRSNLAW